VTVSGVVKAPKARNSLEGMSLNHTALHKVAHMVREVDIVGSRRTKKKDVNGGFDSQRIPYCSFSAFCTLLSLPDVYQYSMAPIFLMIMALYTKDVRSSITSDAYDR